MGVICVETRTVEMTIPADPANLDSETKVSYPRYTSLQFFLTLRVMITLYNFAPFVCQSLQLEKYQYLNAKNSFLDFFRSPESLR